MINKLDKILDKLSKVRTTSEGYMASCPCHLDKTPSLSITCKDNKILLHCFSSGCKIEDIVQELGLEISDLFLEDNMGTATVREKNKGKKYESIDEIIKQYSNIEDVYPYNWLGEEPSGLQIRYIKDNKKEFATYHRENEHWYAGRAKGLSPIYNIDNVDKAKSILIVEGEKKVKIAMEHGIVACCSIGGALNAHNTDWTPLMGKPSVVIWRDYNDAGLKYQNSVLDILKNLGVNVRVVEVEKLGLNEGDDLEQFVEKQKGDIDDVRNAILSVLPKYEDTKATTHLKKYLSKVYNGEVDNLEIPGFPILTEVTQMFIPGSISLIYSQPGVGKSLFVQQIADDWTIKGQVKVKRLLLESSINMYLLRSLSRISDRFDVLKSKFHKENKEESKKLIDEYLELLDLCGGTMTTSDSQSGGRKITDWNDKTVLGWMQKNIKDNRLLVIDPISRILNEAPYLVTNRVTAEIEGMLSENPHASVLLVHHPDAEGGVSGGRGWHRFSHNILQIHKLEEEEVFEILTADGDIITTGIDRYIKIVKCRSGEGLDYKIAIKMNETSLGFKEIGRILRKVK